MCQDVLVVAGTGGASQGRAHLVQNKVARGLRARLPGATRVSVTGTVSGKDGRKRITATKIDGEKD